MPRAPCSCLPPPLSPGQLALLGLGAAATVSGVPTIVEPEGMTRRLSTIRQPPGMGLPPCGEWWIHNCLVSWNDTFCITPTLLRVFIFFCELFSDALGFEPGCSTIESEPHLHLPSHPPPFSSTPCDRHHTATTIPCHPWRRWADRGRPHRRGSGVHGGRLPGRGPRRPLQGQRCALPSHITPHTPGSVATRATLISPAPNPPPPCS